MAIKSSPSKKARSFIPGCARLERIDAVEDIYTRPATRRMFAEEGQGQWRVCDSTPDPYCYPGNSRLMGADGLGIVRTLSLDNRKQSIRSWRPIAAASSRSMAMESVPRGSLRKGLFAVLVPARARRHVAGVIVGPSVLRPGVGIRIV